MNEYLIFFKYGDTLLEQHEWVKQRPIDWQVINAFVEMRETAIKLLNGRYDIWNREYGDVNDQNDYNNYIKNKMQPYIDQVNEWVEESQAEWGFKPIMKLAINDETDIIGIDLWNNKEIHLLLKKAS